MVRIEHEDLEKVKSAVKGAIGKHLDLSRYAVFFFGSRTAGRGDANSDIDVGIEGEKPVPPNIMGEIKEELENLPFLYKIDVVDFKTVSADFYKVAKVDIETIK